MILLNKKNGRDMKKLVIILLAACCALSCGRESLPHSQNGDGAVVFTAGALSRAAFSDDLLSLSWVRGDRIGIYSVKGSEAVGLNYPYEASEAQGASAGLAAVSTQWQYTLASVPGCTYYAYAPFSGTPGEGNAFVIPAQVPSRQVQASAGSVEHLSSYVLLKSYPAVPSETDASVNLRFRNLTAAAEIHVKSSAASGLKIASAVLAAEAPLAFDRGNMVLEGSPDDASVLQVNDAQDTVDLSISEPFQLSTAGSKLYFTLIPGAHAAGSMSLRLVTTDGRTATVAIPEAVNFESNGVYRKSVTVNPSAFSSPSGEGGSYIWKKITASAGVSAGKYVIGFAYNRNDVSKTLLLPCTPVGKNPLPADISGMELSFTSEGDLSAAPDGYVWDIEAVGGGWKVSYSDGSTVYMLAACDKAQGVAISSNGKGDYSNEYSTVWTFSDSASGIQMTVPVSATRNCTPWYDPAAGLDHFEWRMATAEAGAYILFKKTAIQ